MSEVLCACGRPKGHTEWHGGPAGTTSLLLGTSSGVHPVFQQKLERRMRFVMTEEEKKAYAIGRVAKLLVEVAALLEEAASIAREAGVEFEFKLNSTKEEPEPEEWRGSDCTF